MINLFEELDNEIKAVLPTSSYESKQMKKNNCGFALILLIFIHSCSVEYIQLENKLQIAVNLLNLRRNFDHENANFINCTLIYLNSFSYCCLIRYKRSNRVSS